MQYIFLKNILETILTNYTCPHCQNKATEQSLTVRSIQEKSVNMHVQCHVCGTQSELNAEVNPTAAEMLDTKEGRLKFAEFLKSGGAIGATMKNKTSQHIENPDAIKDEDIVKIYDNLRNARSIEELMNE